MATVPHATGKDCKLAFFINGNPVGEFDARSYSVDRNVTEVTDDVLGEDRSRLDAITNFYSISVSTFVTTAAQMQALIDEQANDDANGATTNKSLAIVLTPRGGSGPKKGFKASEISLGGWKLNAGGRTERMMIDYPLRARYFDAVSI